MQFNGWSPGGVRNYVDTDPEDGSLLLTRMQDVTPFLERNKQFREDGLERWRGDDNDFWRVASIPNMVIEEWMRRGINIFDDNDWPKIKKLLNTEYQYLKTAPGEI